jgi:polyhydroxyalkanoate synthesis regulator phasin
MAKNADQDGPDSTGGAKSRAEQLRAAVEGAFGATAQGAAPVQKRAQDLADELVGAASRVRDVLEELRPPSPEELDALRAQVDALERRVAELESATAKSKPKSKPKRA